MNYNTTYFPNDEASVKRSTEVLEVVRNYASEQGIRDIIVPTTTGATGLLAKDLIQGHDTNLVIVTHQVGFRERGKNEVPEETLVSLRQVAQVLVTQHAFAGVGRAVRLKLGSYEWSELLAMVLRTFGQGTKVSAEITIMAADAGLISLNSPVIACGGTGSGLDTAWELLPAHSHQFFDLRFQRLLCKPLFVDPLNE